MQRLTGVGIGKLLSLLAAGVPVDELSDSYTEIVVVAAKGSLSELQEVIKAPNIDINESSKENGITPLMASSAAGHLDCVKYLLDNNAEIDKQDNQGRSALFFAIHHNQSEIFSYLISKNANYTLQDINQRNILHTAANLGRVTITNTILEIIKKNNNNYKLILQKDKFGCTCLHYSVTQKYEEIAENILQLQQYSPNAGEEENEDLLINEKDNEGISAFLYACQQKESEEWVEYLLDEGADITTSDNLGQTALHYAVLTNNNDVIKTLLYFLIENEEFDILYELLNQRAEGGYTPLHYACLVENIDLFKILVSAYKKSLHGNNTQISLNNLVDNKQRNIFHMASYMNNIELCNLIYKYFPTLCSLSDINNRNVLFYAVKNIETSSSRQQKQSNHTNIETCLQWLIENIKIQNNNSNQLQYLNITQQDSQGRNIIHYACYYNNLQQVQYLLSIFKQQSSLLQNNDKLNTSLLDQPDIHGNTPLHIAASRGFSECVRLLILMGAFNMNAEDKFGRTPLHIAIQNKFIDCSQILVQLGANIDVKDYKKRTPLHYACLLELKQSAISETLVQILLQDSTKGIVTSPDIHGISPLHMVCSMGNIRTLKEILHHLLRRVSIGFSGNEKLSWPDSFIDNRKWSPMHFAAYHGQGEILRILLEYFKNTPKFDYMENSSTTTILTPMIQWKDSHGMNVLHFACSYPSSSLCVKVLIEKNHHLDSDFFYSFDNYGRTCLHIAAGTCNIATCKILLDLHPNLYQIKDFSSRLPIDYAKLEENNHNCNDDDYEELLSSLKKSKKISKEISSSENIQKISSEKNIQKISDCHTPSRTPKKLRKKSISNVTIRSRTPMRTSDCNRIPVATSISFSSSKSSVSSSDDHLDFNSHAFFDNLVNENNDKNQQKNLLISKNEKIQPSTPKKQISSTASSLESKKILKTPKSKQKLITTTPRRVISTTPAKRTPLNGETKLMNSSRFKSNIKSKSTSKKVNGNKTSRNKENLDDKSTPIKVDYTAFSHPNVFERLNAHAVARNKARKAREALQK